MMAVEVVAGASEDNEKEETTVKAREKKGGKELIGKKERVIKRG